MEAKEAKNLRRIEAEAWINDNYGFKSKLNAAIGSLNSYVKIEVDPSKWPDDKIKIVRYAQILGYTIRIPKDFTIIFDF